ncbi:hypothetical protein GGI12_006326, partial [Dipsacomyces acuminosporus]
MPAQSRVDLLPDFTSPEALKMQTEWFRLLRLDAKFPSFTTYPNLLKSCNSYAVSAQLESDLIKYAQFSRAAYLLNSTEWNCPKCLDKTSYIYDTEMLKFFKESSYGYIAYNSKYSELIVAFKGMSTLTDMRTELDIELAPWSSGNAANAK